MQSNRVEAVLEVLGEGVVRVVGEPNRFFTHPAPIHEAQSELAITFCNSRGAGAVAIIRQTRAGTVLCSTDVPMDELVATRKALIVVEEPRLSFIRLMNALFAEPKPRGVHPTAVIDPDAEVHQDTYVGPFTYVGKVEVGAGTAIDGHVRLYSRTKIGRNVEIQSGSVIGANGFGFQRNDKSELENFPHVGGVSIADDVSIGVNCVIDRGTLGTTIIGEGTRIGNLVNVGHNAVIGRHAVINSHVRGSSRIGDYAWISPGATMIDSISVGDHATVGAGAVVVKDVLAGTTVLGAPATSKDEFLKRHRAVDGLVEHDRERA